MVRLKGPLYSQKASKQLGHELIYKTYGNRSFLTKYNKPGGVKPFTKSSTQTQMRIIYGEAVEAYQSLSDNEKKAYQEKAKGKTCSGWNIFLKEYYETHSYEMYFSYYGQRAYGLFEYGKT